jgi:serine/threonine protein phosphatase PrpC
MVTSLRNVIKERIDVLRRRAVPLGNRSPFAETTHRRQLFAPSRRLCGLTDIGLSRSNNEDAFHLSDDGTLWIVADGMGGQAAGEVASALAIETVATFVRADEPERRGADILVEAFHEAHAAILAYVREHGECVGMGSAALAAQLKGDTLHICHAGDVRCYVYVQGTLEVLTKDHSVVEELVRSGLLTRQAARTHPDRGQLEQALGVSRRFAPTARVHTLGDGDRVLICSDGLWESIGDEQIASVLSSDGSMRQIATVLADRAIAAGGPDNLTAIVYEHLGSAEHVPLAAQSEIPLESGGEACLRQRTGPISNSGISVARTKSTL